MRKTATVPVEYLLRVEDENENIYFYIIFTIYKCRKDQIEKALQKIVFIFNKKKLIYKK